MAPIEFYLDEWARINERNSISNTNLTHAHSHTYFNFKCAFQLTKHMFTEYLMHVP